MNELVISIKPKYTHYIKSGEKTIEVRKSFPNWQYNPFKVYIYETKDYKIVGTVKSRGCGKIIGHFMCKGCYSLDDNTSTEYIEKVIKNSKLTASQILDYLKGKVGYGWVIENLKIYEKPIDISELGLKRPPQSWQYVKK